MDPNYTPLNTTQSVQSNKSSPSDDKFITVLIIIGIIAAAILASFLFFLIQKRL